MGRVFYRGNEISSEDLIEIEKGVEKLEEFAALMLKHYDLYDCDEYQNLQSIIWHTRVQVKRESDRHLQRLTETRCKEKKVKKVKPVPTQSTEVSLKEEIFG